MARRIRRYRDPMKTKAGRRRAAERVILDEQDEAEHGGGLFHGIPKGPTRTWPELEEAREAAAREPQRPHSLLEIIRKR